MSSNAATEPSKCIVSMFDGRRALLCCNLLNMCFYKVGNSNTIDMFY